MDTGTQDVFMCMYVDIYVNDVVLYLLFLCIQRISLAAAFNIPLMTLRAMLSMASPSPSSSLATSFFFVSHIEMFDIKIFFFSSFLLNFLYLFKSFKVNNIEMIAFLLSITYCDAIKVVVVVVF